MFPADLEPETENEKLFELSQTRCLQMLAFK